MPNLIEAGEILEMKVYCSDSEQASVNTFHYEALIITGNITDQQVSDAFDSSVAVLWPNILANTAQKDGCSCRILNQVPAVAAVLTGNAIVGTGGAVGAPRQGAPLLKFKTGEGGSRGRGRTYLPFMPAAGLAGNGNVSTTFEGEMGDILAALQGFGPITGSGPASLTVRQVIYHRASRTSTAIDDWSLSTKIATQKRRGSFGKANVSPF